MHSLHYICTGAHCLLAPNIPHPLYNRKSAPPFHLPGSEESHIIQAASTRSFVRMGVRTAARSSEKRETAACPTAKRCRQYEMPCYFVPAQVREESKGMGEG